MRKFIFNFIFNEKEKTAIINALYRRVDDKTTENISGEKELTSLCSKLAKEFMI